jgi:acyl-CoA synthetase (AMP-forming)/AMP-acid ligase II
VRADTRSPELRLQLDPSRYCAPRFLEDITARGGDRVAIRFEQRDLRYCELASQSRALARALAAAGVVKGARVAVLMANRPEWAVASFAIGLVGGVLVPVNTFATPVERDYILRHSDASLLLAQPTLLKRDFVAELLEGHPELANCEPGALRCPALPHLRGVAVLGPGGGRGAIQTWEQLLARGETVSEELLDAMADEVVPSDDGVLIYTSGTTAHPKGVLHMQRAPVIQSWRFAESMQLTEDDVVFTAQPFFWTAGMAMSLGATLAAGARLVLQETFEPGAALELIEAERATAVHAWPHQEKALAEHPSAPQRDLSRVRKVEFSSPLAALVGLEKDEWGTYGSYGLSETFTLAAALPASAPAELRRKTSGLPLPGISLRIVDPETGNLLADPRGKGEIALKGVTLMRGYYKVAPELCFDAEGYFHTQDGGSFDADGYLHWTGRLSNLIKTGGANVSPLEIERALDADPEIRVALAVGVPHPVLGEVITLCVVCADGEEPAPDQARAKEQALREGLRSKLAAYKVPKRVLFFRASELAYTANQKIQVGPLQQAALARLQRERAEIDGVLYQAPEGSSGSEGSA